MWNVLLPEQRHPAIDQLLAVSWTERTGVGQESRPDQHIANQSE